VNDESSKYQAATDQDSLRASIYNLLANYRLQNWVDEDGESGFPLVDALSNGAGTIAPGLGEIEFIADAIAAHLEASGMVPPVDASQPAEQPMGDLDKAIHAIDDLVALNGEEHDEAAWKLIRDCVLASQPKAATDAQVAFPARHVAVLRRYLQHLQSSSPTQSTRPSWAELKQALRATVDTLIHPAPSQAVGSPVFACTKCRDTKQVWETFGTGLAVSSRKVPCNCAEQAVATAGDGVTEEIVDAAMLAWSGYWCDCNDANAAGNNRDAMEAALAALASPSAPRVGVPIEQSGDVVAHCLLRKNGHGKWVNDAKRWVDGVPAAELERDVAKHPDLYRISYAYAKPLPTGGVPDGVVRDAARYRWLNCHIQVTVNHGCPSHLGFEMRTDADRNQPHSLLIDQAIDIAMRATAPAPGKGGEA